MRKDKRLTDTRERLFEAALELFADKGVDAVSIRDLTRKVGISTAGFYNHFESKNALLKAIYDYYRETLIEKAPRTGDDMEALPDKLGPVELLLQSVSTFRIAMENPVLDRLGKIIATEKHRNAVAAEISFDDRQRLLGFMEDLFVAMKEKGLLPRGDPRVLGRMFGYIQLGIVEDNVYYRYMKGMGVDGVVRRQNEELKRFLEELMGG
jgi:TetR/AcrR family transcriptional regulator, biofilm operon repressor